MRAAMLGVLTAGALTLAPVANAADAYIGGVFGVSPRMSTLTGPSGEKCGSSCQRIRFDNLSTQSAQSAVDSWVTSNGNEGNTIWGYSESTTAIVDHLNAHPEDHNTYILLGSPAVPGNGNSRIEGGRAVTTNTVASVTFVSVNSDSVAQPKTPGASLMTHLTGYDNLDARTPKTSVVVSPNVVSRVYDKPLRPNKTARVALAVKTPKVDRKALRASKRAERQAANKTRTSAR